MQITVPVNTGRKLRTRNKFVTRALPIQAAANFGVSRFDSCLSYRTKLLPTKRDRSLHSTCQRSSAKTIEKRIAIVSATVSGKAFECEERRDSEFNFQELDTRARLQLFSLERENKEPYIRSFPNSAKGSDNRLSQNVLVLRQCPRRSTTRQ